MSKVNKFVYALWLLVLLALNFAWFGYMDYGLYMSTVFFVGFGIFAFVLLVVVSLFQILGVNWGNRRVGK